MASTILNWSKSETRAVIRSRFATLRQQFIMNLLPLIEGMSEINKLVKHIPYQAAEHLVTTRQRLPQNLA